MKLQTESFGLHKQRAYKEVMKSRHPAHPYFIHASQNFSPIFPLLHSSNNTYFRVVSTLTRAFVRQQLVAFSAVALKAANGVSAEVLAAAVLELTLVNIYGKRTISLQIFP